MSVVTEKAAQKYMAEVDPVELACRMIERANGFTRPEGKTPAECLIILDPENRAWVLGMANVALEYVSECFAASNRVS